MADWRTWDFGTGFKRVFYKYYPDMIKHINPKEILPYISSLLRSTSDEEEIIHEQNNRGARSAVYKLKECLLRKGKTKEFVDALHEVGLTELADKMVEDLEIACGRQPNRSQMERGQGDMPPTTLAERGQRDTRVTMTHCVVKNLQIGAHSHMSVTKSSDRRTDGDMSTMDANDSSRSADVSASSSENCSRQTHRTQLECVETTAQESETSVESKLAETAEKTNEKEFQSRFFTDFDPKAFLGKGGFGVVFEARNKMDDCLYAIKRISLNNSEQAKQKVIREVKALAKLEHTGIVRYYQSWFESPPPGWQEQHDQQYHDMFSTADYTTEPNPQSTTRGHCVRNPPGGFTDMSSSVASYTRSDTGFSVSVGVSTRSHYSEETDDSLLSESRDTTSRHNIAIKDATDSIDIVFQDSQQKGDSHNHTKPEMSHISDTLNVTDRQPCIGRRSGSGDACSDTHSVTSKQSGEKETGAATKYVPRLLLYIQMQLCQRESLRDWLCANTLNRDRKQVLDMFDQILSAVDYVHECGLMHRDLKPSNIFFSLDGAVKVGDFGLVTASEEHVTEGDFWGDRVTSQTHRCHTNQVGTKLYMSPEQIAGDSYTHKVDIFALGMIFFELFCPFDTEMERVETMLEVKRLKFPERFSQELPTECTFLKPLLSHKPDERPDTKDIRSHAILVEFEEVRAAVKRLRIISSSRHHTDSPSSHTSVDKDHS